MNRAQQLPFSYLATAALALAFSAPAYAQVSVDYQQLDGMGTPRAAPTYDDVRPVRSPLDPDQMSAVGVIPPVVANTTEDTQPGTLPPIRLKPLAKWKMPAPEEPISLGMRTPIFLNPPGVNTHHMIAAIAQQSPTQKPLHVAAAVPLHLRPPAPIPPQGLVSSQLAGMMPPRTVISPPLSTMVEAPVPIPQTQIASGAPTDVAPAPTTEIKLAIAAVSPPPAMSAIVAPPSASAITPAPSTTAAPAPAPLPVFAQSDLRPEDVVALDLGAPQHENTPGATSASPEIAPPPAPAPHKETEYLSAPVVPPPPPEALPPPTKTAKSEFISPLTEGLPTDNSDNSGDHSTDNRDSHMAPPAPARAEPEPQPKFTAGSENLMPEQPPQTVALSDKAPALLEPPPIVPAPFPVAAAPAPMPEMKVGILKDPTPPAAPPAQEVSAPIISPAAPPVPTIQLSESSPSPASSPTPAAFAPPAKDVSVAPAETASSPAEPPSTVVTNSTPDLAQVQAKIKEADARTAEANAMLAQLNPATPPALQAAPEPIKTAAISAPPTPVAITSEKPAAFSVPAVPPLVQKTLVYSPGATTPPQDALDAMQQFAQQIQNNPNAKIVLSAYADMNGTTGSAARRVSLERAIQVRDEFNKLGVPTARVAVNAQTSDPGTENPDRVDITIQQ